VGDITRSLARPACDTLTARVMAMVPGLPCFCCGSRLATAEAGTTPLRSASSLLWCSHCGAEVLRDEQTQVPGEPGRVCARALVAA
jgi:hypothetical protein